MANTHTWDGKGRGSPLGHRFFFMVIRFTGLLPAYFFVIPACLRYVLFERRSNRALVLFREKLGLKTTFIDRYRHFVTFGINLVDRFSFLLRNEIFLKYECVNEDRIRKAREQGRGAVLLSAHVGNWEIAGNLLRDRLDCTMKAVMLDAEREALRRVQRTAFNQRRFGVIPATGDGTGTSLAIMQALRNNELVALHGDRTMKGRSITVPFLGTNASFPLGPFAVAAAAGSVVIPVFTMKTGFKTYRFEAFEPVDFKGISRADRDNAIENGVRQFVETLEKIVRTWPEQWYNFYDFWGASQ